MWWRDGPDPSRSGDSTSRAFSDDWDRPRAAAAGPPLRRVALRVPAAALQPQWLRKLRVRKLQPVRVPLRQAPKQRVPARQAPLPGLLRRDGSTANRARRRDLARASTAAPVRARLRQGQSRVQRSRRWPRRWRRAALRLVLRPPDGDRDGDRRDGRADGGGDWLLRPSRPQVPASRGRRLRCRLRRLAVAVPLQRQVRRAPRCALRCDFGRDRDRVRDAGRRLLRSALPRRARRAALLRHRRPPCRALRTGSA